MSNNIREGWRKEWGEMTTGQEYDAFLEDKLSEALSVLGALMDAAADINWIGGPELRSAKQVLERTGGYTRWPRKDCS